MSRPGTLVAAALAVVLPAVLVAQTSTPPPTTTRQNPPIPRPFPGVNPPSTPATPPAELQTVAGEVMVGNAPVYPAAVRLDEFDAGQGQTFYIFGTNLPYEDLVNYYRARLQNSGREIFEAPAMRQWDLGRFDDDTMAYPPSVVVKDYTWNGSAGYLHIEGTTETRYRTIIQIVPGAGPGGGV